MQLQEFLLEKIKKNSIQPQAGKESLSIKAPAASNGGFDPRGSRQISIQAWILGSLLAGIKNAVKSIFTHIDFTAGPFQYGKHRLKKHKTYHYIPDAVGNVIGQA